MKLRQAIQQVQELGKQHGFILVLVGGGTVRLLGEKTRIVQVDEKQRCIILQDALDPLTQRSDKTLIDLDMIAFAIHQTAENPKAFEGLQKALRALQKKEGFPPISLEPVLYHKEWQNPNMLTQFNSSIEKDTQGYFFRLDTIKQYVQADSLNTWKWIFAENPTGYIVTFSPLALQIRYAIRGFARKPKDLQKIWDTHAPFNRLVNQFTEKIQAKHSDDFIEWYAFEKALQTNQQIRVVIKRQFYKLFWNTIGTYLAHGTGIVGKVLLPLGNSFFAGK